MHTYLLMYTCMHYMHTYIHTHIHAYIHACGCSVSHQTSVHLLCLEICLASVQPPNVNHLLCPLFFCRHSTIVIIISSSLSLKNRYKV